MKLIFIFLCAPLALFGQVGINTISPSATLDVQGNMRVDNSVFLENPGANDDIRNSLLLLRKQDGSVAQYDIDDSKYGPVNYSQYILRKTGKEGLQDFDTKINIQEYIVTVQGFYFLTANDDQPSSTNTLIKSNNNLDNIEGYQFYSYQNTTTGTWFIKALVNDSDFQGQYTTDDYSDTVVDIFLNVVIYRQKLITKALTNIPIIVDMGNTETATAPLPAGF